MAIVVGAVRGVGDKEQRDGLRESGIRVVRISLLSDRSSKGSENRKRCGK